MGTRRRKPAIQATNVCRYNLLLDSKSEGGNKDKIKKKRMREGVSSFLYPFLILDVYIRGVAILARFYRILMYFAQ